MRSKCSNVEPRGPYKDPKAVKPRVSFGKLISLCSGEEKCMMYMGLFAAACTGAGMPLFALIMGQVFNTFVDHPTLQEIFD